MTADLILLGVSGGRRMMIAKRYIRWVRFTPREQVSTVEIHYGMDGNDLEFSFQRQEEGVAFYEDILRQMSISSDSNEYL